MELRTYIEVLWRRMWVIAATAVTTLVVVVVGTLLATPVYEASTTLRAATALAGSVSYTDYTYSERLMNTYAEIAASGPVLGELGQRLGLDELPEIEAEVVPNTELIEITVQDPSPALARDVANVLAEILVAQSNELYSGGGKTAHEILGEQLAQVEQELAEARAEQQEIVGHLPLDAQRITALNRSIALKEGTYATLLEQYDQARVRDAIRANTLSVVEPATLPETAAKPRKVLNIALGLVVGLGGGTGLAFLFENLDRTVYTTEEIERVTGFPILAKVPEFGHKQDSVFFDGHSSQVEAFRRLRTRVSRLDHGVPPQTLLVTSAQPGEGKSTVVSNLALSLAQSGRKVIVVDADLRRPVLHRIFRLPNKLGLSSIIERHVELDRAVQDREIPQALAHSTTTDPSWSKIWRRLPWLKVLTSGPLPHNPVQVLSSTKMPALLDQLKERYDIVLFDTPALLGIADAMALAPAVDGVLLVVGRGQASRTALQAACHELADVEAKVLGIVVNRAEQGAGEGYYSLAPSRRNGHNGANGGRQRRASTRGEHKVVGQD